MSLKSATGRGGNLKQVVAESEGMINDKIEVEMEIQTMIAGSQNELNVMILYAAE